MLLGLLAMRERSPGAEASARIERQTERIRNRLSKIDVLSRDVSDDVIAWDALVLIQALRQRALSRSDSARLMRESFGVPSERVDFLLDRLLELEVITENDRSKYRATQRHLVGESASSNLAFRTIHRKFLELAIEALETRSDRARYSCSEVFTFSEDRLPELKKLSDRFLDDLQMLASRGRSAEARIYSAVFHAFPIGDPR